MRIGPLVRKAMPFRVERGVAQLYRRVFVDLEKVARALAPALPGSANILDIGGGDGELINELFRLRSDLRVSMVDIAPSVGKFLEPANRQRVKLYPATALEMHLKAASGRYDAALVSDVMHHIPAAYRLRFLQEIRAALKPGAPVFIKDIEPGHPIATLSYLSDVYVSGDRGVSLVSMDVLRELVKQALPSYSSKELGLLGVNAPNYLLRFSTG